MITPYHPSIVIYNESCNTKVLLELTYPLDTFQHLELARDCKQYLILSEYSNLYADYSNTKLSLPGLCTYHSLHHMQAKGVATN